MIAPNRAEHLFLDLDGTLTDPSEGITKGVLHALSRMHANDRRPENLLSFIGPPLRESFMIRCGFSAGEAQRAIKFFQEYYAAEGILQNVPYPGIRELLKRLAAAGKKLVLATSKPEPYAIRILERFGMIDFFHFVAGGDIAETKVRKADVIAGALQSLGMQPLKNEAFMIGDRSYDVLGAAEHGIPAIGVLYGFGDREELSRAGAAFLAGSVDDLGRLLLS